MSELDIIRQEIHELRTINLISQKDALDMEEAMLYTGLSKKCLYALCQSRSIPHYKSKGGKKTYFLKSDLNGWMLHTKVTPSAEVESSAARMAYLRN